MDYLVKFFSFDRLGEKALYSLQSVVLYSLAILVLEFFLTPKNHSTLRRLVRRPFDYRYDLISMLINLTGIKKAFANLCTFGLIAYLGHLRQSSELLPLFKLDQVPLWVKVSLTFLIYDLGLYFLHRLRHRWDFLWISHSYHHSCLDVNPMTSNRQHILDYVNFYLFLIFPLSLLLPLNVDGLMIWVFLEQVIQIIAHSKIKLFNHPIYSKVFVSPCAHRLHHSIEGEGQRKNFGSIFIFWDKIFQTYETGEFLEIETGVKGDLAENPSFWKGYWQIFPMTLKAILRPFL